MNIGSLEGRVLLSAGLVALLLVWDVVLPWARQKLLRRPEAAGGADAFSEGTVPVPASAAAGTADDALPAGVAPGRPSVLTETSADDRPAVGTEAQKTWAAARELPHQFIPDWKHDEGYLNLLHEAAVGGSEEAMDKLSEYAFRRNAFVEAYYWKLKLEMAGGRIFDFKTKDILAAWVACGCPTQYRNVMRGFSEEQGMFARAVMRVKVGIYVSKANRRLKMLAKQGNADAQQYLGRGNKS